MKVHSVIDIITNSSTELFTINTNEELDEVIEKIQEIWKEVSKKSFPFYFSKPADDYILFDAGYYWGFYGYQGTEDDPYGDLEFERFTDKLRELYPDFTVEQIG